MRLLRSTPSLETVVVFAVICAGVIAIAVPISDNSMLLHMRTGAAMAEIGSFPHTDPYSFSASGVPWTVQSWFAELLYGVLNQLGGWHAVILLNILLTAATAAILGTLSRTGNMPRTAVVAVVVTALSWSFWTHRPLLFGYLFFAVVVLIYQRKWSPLALLPIGWLWVNTHGSFPLIFLWLAATLVGEVFDERSWRGIQWRYPVYLAGGVLLGVINPYGADLLIFSAEALSGRGEIFALINEWRSPNFHSLHGLLLLAPLVVGVAVVARNGIAWSKLFPLVAFLALGLYSQRNLPLLAIVLAVAMADALRSEVPSRKPSRVVVQTAMLVLLLAIAGSVVRVTAIDPLDLDDYPDEAYAFIQRTQPAGVRVVAPDYVGCWRIFLEGDRAQVFIDDRFDMYPAAIGRDYVSLRYLNSEQPTVVLDRYAADVVVWPTEQPLSHFLGAVDGWNQQWSDEDWSVFVRERG